MHLIDRTLRWQRGLLAVTLALAALGFTRATRDVFNTPKATIIVVGVILVLAVGAIRVTRTRRLVVPSTWAWAAVGLFLVGLVVGTVVADSPMWAVVGRAGRHTGLAMYAVYVVVFALAIRCYRGHPPTVLVWTLLATAVPIALYGLGQSVGIEPYDWNAIEGGPQVFATFGNANFYAAWLGIVTPLAAWGALTRAWSRPWRLVSAALTVLMVVAAFVSDSLQGPAVGVAGAAFVALVWLWTTDEPIGRRRVPLTVAGGGVAALLLAGVVAGLGPLSAIRQGAVASFSSRLGKWETAVAMFGDRPLFGFGLDSMADWFHRYRPQWVAVEDGLERTVDAPHNVPLDMLISGGVILFVGYLAVVGFTAWALVVGLRRLTGEQRLLLAGLGGAWLAYQLQSLVSIDVPPLAVLHWLLAGLIVSMGAAPPLRQWALPGAPPLPTPKPPKGKKGKKAKARRQEIPLAPPSPALKGVVVVGTLAVLWVALIPVRADIATAEGVEHAAADDTRAADAAFERAAALTPYEPRPAQTRGEWMLRAGLNKPAYQAYREAAARQPRSLSYMLNLARLASKLEKPEEAGRWYDRALVIDPKTPEVLAQVGEYEAEHGDPERAERLLEEAVAVDDERQADWWVALGDARSASGDDAGARKAYERALDIDPDAEGAAEALDQLALEPAGEGGG